MGNAGAKGTKKVGLELCSGSKSAEAHISPAPYKPFRILILLEARCGREALESIKRYKKFFNTMLQMDFAGSHPSDLVRIIGKRLVL